VASWLRFAGATKPELSVLSSEREEQTVANRLTNALPMRFREPGIRGHQAGAGWLFLSPVIIILGLFLVLPILLAAWVSFSDWNGNGSPLGAHAHWVGLTNYRHLVTTPGLDQSNFGTSLRNNFYYVLLVVPIQTAIALFLAVLVNRRVKFVGFFRTAFYFPSVTSSVAITILFLFLFSPSGAINKILSYFGATGPAWLYDPRGLFHVILGQFGVSQDNPPGGLVNHVFLGVSYWDWLAGPSIAMCVFIVMAVFTTSGTFMLLFLAALQNVDESINEAAALDGATEWRKFRHVTAPMIRPTIFTVVTLGLIGTWQVFDQIYVGTKGQPLNTTLTPAFLSFNASFNAGEWGVGAALAFILFAIIVFFTVVTRLLTRNPEYVPRRRRFKSARAATVAGGAK
jgi:multiple sugar transport system permease protein